MQHSTYLGWFSLRTAIAINFSRLLRQDFKCKRLVASIFFYCIIDATIVNLNKPVSVTLSTNSELWADGGVIEATKVYISHSADICTRFARHHVGNTRVALPIVPTSTSCSTQWTRFKENNNKCNKSSQPLLPDCNLEDDEMTSRVLFLTSLFDAVQWKTKLMMPRFNRVHASG